MRLGRFRRAAEDRVDDFSALVVVVGFALVLLMLVDFDDLDSLSAGVLAVFVTGLAAGAMILAFSASGVGKRSMQIAVIVAALTVGGTIVNALLDQNFTPGLLWLAVAAASPLVVLKRIMSNDHVTGTTIYGAVSVYLLVAMAFSFAYLSLDSAFTFSFTPFDRIPVSPFFGQPEPSTAFPYFSLVTITTLGYGDLAPATEIGKALAVTEAVVGQVFLVVVVARFVSLWGRPIRRGPRGSAVSADAPGAAPD